MKHQEAAEQMAVEKYLLHELSPSVRDEFEEHFFDCPACAAELKATAAFLRIAKHQLGAKPVARTAPRPSKKSSFEFLWHPAFLSPAFALLLVVIGYQTLVIRPRLTAEIARLRAPEVLPAVALINSRGAGVPYLNVSAAQSFLLPVDIPTADQYQKYSCDLVTPSGSTAWSLPVSAEQAKNTVSIRMPAAAWASGTYTLIVKAYSEPSAAPVEIERYHFTLSTSH